MSGIVTLPGSSLDQIAGLIAMLRASTMRVILLTRSIFDVASVARVPASAGVERRIVRTTGIRPATIHTPLARSLLHLIHADVRGPKLSAQAQRLITAAINRAFAEHGSGPKPIGDTAPALTVGCY
jgi:hypothetical protein